MTVLEQSLSQRPIAEGKTKRIHESTEDPAKVFVMSKDDITAGDGAKRDVMKGKAMFANRTTCNVFRLLKSAGIPVAFEREIGTLPPGTPESFGYCFEAKKCKMLPYEVIVRREAHGSFLKRSPHLKKGRVFPRLVLEFFLKTNDRKWRDYHLECDDPYMIHESGTRRILLYDPKQANLPQTPAQAFLSLSEDEVFSSTTEAGHLGFMDIIARKSFLVLEKAWQLQQRTLVDYKVEFGIGPNNELLLADVIDNDSWRVLDGEKKYMDKQIYRDGGDLDEVSEKYRQVADLTAQFKIPSQRLIVWRGSEKDALQPFYDTLNKLVILQSNIDYQQITISAHKQPGSAYRTLQELIQNVPDAVIIAYIGRSNGAGPTLSANTTVPVITVPADYKDFPDDIWSSLRAPSNAPIMTVLEPSNAVLAALQILAMRNPALYASLRYEQETRLADI